LLRFRWLPLALLVALALLLALLAMLNAQIADVVAPGGKRGREHGVVLKRGTLTNRKGLHLEEVRRNRRALRRRGRLHFLEVFSL